MRKHIPAIAGALAVLFLFAFPFAYRGADYNYLMHLWITALFYAIKSETQDLGREANLPDREAYLRLFPLSNKKLLYAITHPKLPVEYFLTIGNALDNTRIFL